MNVYPTVEAAPDEEYHGVPFYPGRVLLGTNDRALIWAYLRRVGTDNRTRLEIYYSDYGRDENKGRTFLHMSEFVPWCRLLVGDKASLGSHVWEDRVRIIVKIVMLEAGYCDGTVSGIPSAMIAVIRANIDKGVVCLAPATTTISETPSSDVPSRAVVLSAPRGGGRFHRSDDITVKEDPAKYYIQALKNAIPAEHWFHTEAIAPHEERQMFLLVDTPDRFCLFPWKVFLGHLRNDNKTPVWAAFGRYQWTKTSDKLGSRWRMCFYDDDLAPTKLPMTLSGDVNFAVAF
jgi:hypothetical protein